MKFAISTLLASSTLALSACSIPHINESEYIAPITGRHVVDNTTPQSERLVCLGRHIAEKRLLPAFTIRSGINPSNPVRFAVGRIEDLTGKQDLVNGKRLTQGAALMAISALGLTQLPLVERYDLTVAETEFKYTDNKLIGDSQTQSFRQTFVGSVPGSDFHFVGGITENNLNIRSGEAEGTVRYFGGSTRYAVIDVALDMRLINTRTLEVISAHTFRKQIIGTEFRTGYFKFFNENFIDLSASERSQEPVQRAIRMVVEHSIYRLLMDLYRIPAATCDPVIVDENSQMKLTAEIGATSRN
jgi:curli biogenesis system outer membrane secretion channel CsgG